MLDFFRPRVPIVVSGFSGGGSTSVQLRFGSWISRAAASWFYISDVTLVSGFSGTSFLCGRGAYAARALLPC